MTMNEYSNDDNEILCDCSGTTKGKILSLIDEGVDTLDAISRRTGTNSGCGSCEYDIQDLLDDLVSSNKA
jgi:bacterioferritin-associated ferredoxin